MAQYLAFQGMGGLTIVQTMLILLVVGIVGSIVIDYVIDKRCQAEPTREMCAKRQ